MAAAFCGRCGADLAMEQRFCHRCGSPIQTQAASTQSSSLAGGLPSPVPPPPSASRPEAATVSGVQRAYRWLRWLFIAAMVAFVGEIVSSALTIDAYQTHVDLGTQLSYDQYLEVRSIDVGLAIVKGIIWVSGLVALIVWTRFAYVASAAGPIAPTLRKYTKSMAIGAYFIPIANLVIPKKVISEIERVALFGSGHLREVANWQGVSVDKRGTWWWGLHIVGVFLLRASSSALKSPTSDGLETAEYFTGMSLSIASNLVLFGSTALGIGYLGRVTTALGALRSRMS